MKIGIICAMDEETEFLLSKLENCTKSNLGKIVIYEGRTSDGKDIVLSRSGIGKSNAAAVAALMISIYKVSYLINSGIAGSMNKVLNIGDLVFSTSACYHDVDFTVFNYKIGQVAQEPAEFNASPELIAKAEIASDTIPDLKGRIKKGLIISGDQFINTPEKKAEILKNFPNAMATECEGAAIAQMAVAFNVPFIIIRSISDTSDENEVDTYEFNVKTASENSAKLVVSLIRML